MGKLTIIEMDEQQINEILEKLESKKRDCESFSKKYQTRKMEDLYQYYEGAKWAIDYSIALIKNTQQ